MTFIADFFENHPIKKIGRGEYIVGGKGKVGFLVFPGSGQDANACFDLVDEFEKKYKAIAVSYTNFYDLGSFFEFVNEVLEKEGVDKVTIYGLSLGGFLAQHYVRRFPETVESIILSHSSTTQSKTTIRRVIRPGKFVYQFLPFIPQRLLNRFVLPVAGRVQAGNSNLKTIWNKYSTKENLERRIEFGKRTTFVMIDKDYLKTVHSLGTEMERLEKKFTPHDLDDWKGKILVIRTENDPLAQDDGMFMKWYPNAKVVTFQETGHLSAFIRFEEMVKVIQNFLYLEHEN